MKLDSTNKTEDLHVRVPEGWKKKLDGIGAPIERDRAYLTRQALVEKYPELREVKK